MAPNYKELYEQQKDKQIADGFTDLKGDIKDLSNETKQNTRHLEKINGRLSRVEDKQKVIEDEVFPDKPETVQQLPSLWRDPQVIKLAIILATAIVLSIIVFASLKGINLPKGLF